MLKALSPSRLTALAGFSSPRSGITASSTNAETLVAGMDISEWAVVEVTGIHPGPLGILLDGNYPDAAVLDAYAPVNAEGGKGAVEADGRVIPGSVLVGVNEYDLIGSKLSLQEVGRVLRDTSHVIRTLRFKVPMSRKGKLELDPAMSPTDKDTRVLLKGAENSSFKDNNNNNNNSDSSDAGQTRGWTLRGLLSPTSAATAEPQQPQQAQSPPPTPIAVSVKDKVAVVDGMTDLRAATPATSTSPATKTLTATVPPGPIGLNLDGAILDRAVVLGFLPLPDGSKGQLELRGDIPVGATLVSINGFDVSRMSLEETRSRLGALAGMSRELVFELPPPAKPLDAEGRLAAFNQLPDLDKRRRLELGLVLKHDRTKLHRHECWFVVDAQWMARWIEFTSRNGPLPGPITNEVLLEPEWEARVRGQASGRPDTARQGLELMRDYRCVTPMVWAILSSIYGTGNVPVLARYLLDIYAEPLAHKEVSSILHELRLKAATLVDELRGRCPSAF